MRQLRKCINRCTDSVLTKRLTEKESFICKNCSCFQSQGPSTQPYWLEHKMEEGAFQCKRSALIGIPADIAPALHATFNL